MPHICCRLPAICTPGSAMWSQRAASRRKARGAPGSAKTRVPPRSLAPSKRSPHLAVFHVPRTMIQFLCKFADTVESTDGWNVEKPFDLPNVYILSWRLGSYNMP